MGVLPGGVGGLLLPVEAPSEPRVSVGGLHHGALAVAHIQCGAELAAVAYGCTVVLLIIADVQMPLLQTAPAVRPEQHSGPAAGAAAERVSLDA